MYVYLVGNLELRWFKIGLTSSLKERLQALQHGVPFQLQVFHVETVMLLSSAYALETKLHMFYHGYRLPYGEWFRDIDVVLYPTVCKDFKREEKLT